MAQKRDNICHENFNHALSDYAHFGTFIARSVGNLHAVSQCSTEASLISAEDQLLMVMHYTAIVSYGSVCLAVVFEGVLGTVSPSVFAVKLEVT